MKKPYIYYRDDRGFAVDEVRAVQRGWWCPVCGRFWKKNVTYPICGHDTKKWLRVYSEPVRKGK